MNPGSGDQVLILEKGAKIVPDSSCCAVAASTVTRIGPSYLYPDHAATPGLVSPDITQANIDQTICNPQWSTKSIRPPVSYTNTLKTKQLAASHATDRRRLTVSFRIQRAQKARP